MTEYAVIENHRSSPYALHLNGEQLRDGGLAQSLNKLAKEGWEAESVLPEDFTTHWRIILSRWVDQ